MGGARDATNAISLKELRARCSGLATAAAADPEIAMLLRIANRAHAAEARTRGVFKDGAR